MNLRSILRMYGRKNKSGYKEAIKDWNFALDQQFITLGIDDLLRMRSALVDKLLADIWKKNKLKKSNLSLNAVGGYGRLELHLHSDIDISIIAKNKISNDDKGSLECFLTELWDIGLEVGHSVRTLSEMKDEIKRDVITATNMLDIRTISGDPEHAQIVLNNL